MKIFFSRIPILLILLVNTCFCQVKKDTILLLTGEILSGKITEMTIDHLTIKESEKIAHGYNIDNDRIFSYIDVSGEHFLYVYDTLSGNNFTIAEMRYFLKGERDGKKGVKARPAFYTNLLIGAASGLSGSFFFPVPAFTFAVLVGLPKVKIKKNTVSNPDDLNHIPYIIGYERAARRNRKIQSFIGGGIGLVAGLGSFIIIQNSNK